MNKLKHYAKKKAEGYKSRMDVISIILMGLTVTLIYFNPNFAILTLLLTVLSLNYSNVLGLQISFLEKEMFEDHLDHVLTKDEPKKNKKKS